MVCIVVLKIFVIILIEFRSKWIIKWFMFLIGLFVVVFYFVNGKKKNI